MSRGTWTDFDQTEFVFDIDFYESGIGQSGKVFIPDQCYTKECRLHISFHECEGSGDDMASTSQYAQFGATNDIITVFPNSACWGVDEEETGTSGFNGGTYDGVYVKFVNNLICRLTSSEDYNDCETRDQSFSGANYLSHTALALLASTFLLL